MIVASRPCPMVRCVVGRSGGGTPCVACTNPACAGFCTDALLVEDTLAVDRSSLEDGVEDSIEGPVDGSVDGSVEAGGKGVIDRLYKPGQQHQDYDHD